MAAPRTPRRVHRAGWEARLDEEVLVRVRGTRPLDGIGAARLVEAVESLLALGARGVLFDERQAMGEDSPAAGAAFCGFLAAHRHVPVAVVAGSPEVARKVEARVGATSAEFKLEREDGAQEDELKFLFDTAEVEAKVEFESENVTGEQEVELKVQFRELLEFEDADGDGAFDAGERVVQALALPAARWHSLAVEDASAGNAQGKGLRARADLPGGGLFGLDFFVFGDFATLEGTSLEPTEVKFDILIEGFPFASNTSRLALRLETRHEAEFEAEAGEEAEDDAEVAGDEDGLVVRAGAVKALLTWKETASVDGRDEPVRFTLEREETEREVEEGEAEVEEKQVLVLAYARGPSCTTPCWGSRGLAAQASGPSCSGPRPGSSGGVPEAPGARRVKRQG